ncbi:three-Cys-motif partner protein TcmP [Bosea rubneri]|uniref:Three-Cys-motif partner protein TcmP n=1 Tax=Bosea rubneri TaxID=3075434 RepID=A0ABU3SCA0_9HYPH|nr:three-Cys-motif partner protein TcmP [Bosea sp. ZW T0_25]MDU0342421.1 three-Cys-motif partner protein TcmP [Bosea sp. ZW T0_25]
MAEKFFEEREDQSEVKARIVSKYFYAWANVILPSASAHNSKIAYIDLFAGPGRYKDGAVSTPLMIVEKAIETPKLRDNLVTMFNDENPSHTKNLEGELGKLNNIRMLKYRPVISTGSVGEAIADQLATVRLVPTFSFIDPFGYKGLSLKLINGAIKDWGCDCVFFFNYNRINAGVSNSIVDRHINALFGDEIATDLRTQLSGLTPPEREQLILEKLAQAIKALGGKYVLPFRFRNAAGTRSTHHLVFVSKHEKGYEIMKEILYKESSTHDQGVASLEYSPANARTPLLFSLQQPLNKLEGELLNLNKGKALRVIDIYRSHHVDTPFIKRNYKECLLQLEAQSKVSAEPAKRRKGTMADDVIVTFPP